jgi:MFS family permease
VLLISATLLFLIRPEHFTARKRPAAEMGEKAASQPGLRSAVKVVLHDRLLSGLAVALIMVGFLNNGVLQFQNVFLAELGATKSMISLAGTVSAMVEIPFMLLADQLARRYGPERLMVISLGVTALYRLLVFAIPGTWTIVGVNLVGGVSFSLYTIAYIGLISSRTPREQTSTVMALFASTLGGSVNMIASPLSGALFDAIGARWLYGLAAAGYVLGALSLWLSQSKVKENGES